MDALNPIVTGESAAYATPKAVEASPSPLQKGRGVARCRLSRGPGSITVQTSIGVRTPRPMPLGIGTWSGGGKACGYANWNVGFIRQPGCDSPGCRINSAFRWCCEDAPARTFLFNGTRNWNLIWRVLCSELLALGNGVSPVPPHPGPCSFSKVIHRRRGEPSEALPAADGE